LFSFDDPERTTTGLTPCKPIRELKPFKGGAETASTWAYEQAREELPVPAEYRLHSHILKHTMIS
jgi:hypothetical protein